MLLTKRGITAIIAMQGTTLPGVKTPEKEEAAPGYPRRDPNRKFNSAT